MIKFLSVCTAVSVLFLSGCIDLSDSSSDHQPESNPEPEPESKFFGVWLSPCDANYLDTLTISIELITVRGYEFENQDCTGTAVEKVRFDYGVSYGDQVTVNSGVEATQVIITTVDNNDDGVVDIEQLALELFYRDGNNLYFGDYTDTEETWATDIDYDFSHTLK